LWGGRTKATATLESHDHQRVETCDQGTRNFSTVIDRLHTTQQRTRAAGRSLVWCNWGRPQHGDCAGRCDGGTLLDELSRHTLLLHFDICYISTRTILLAWEFLRLWTAFGGKVHSRRYALYNFSSRTASYFVCKIPCP
jgi:hypothetical protein